MDGTVSINPDFAKIRLFFLFHHGLRGLLPGRNGSSEQKTGDFSGETGEIATTHIPEKSTYLADVVKFNRLRENEPLDDPNHKNLASLPGSPSKSTPDVTPIEISGF